MSKKDKMKKGELKQHEGENEFATDWDIEKYHQDFEPDDHWKLKRLFIETHKKKFPEEKLVCLAQVFTNMEFMGCKYPAETMHRVAELSRDVAKNFRAERANRLKRTFITASNAAEARVKGRKNKSSSNKQLGPPANGFKEIDLFEGLRFGKFVIFLHGGRNCLRESAQRSNVHYDEVEILEANGRKKAEIYVDNVLVASACKDTFKASKESAFQEALKILQKCSYCIKQNPSRKTIKIEKSNNKLTCDIIETETTAPDSSDDNKLDASNKGYKIMKLMGWSGGGLGRQQQGREDPVSYLLKNNRTGLGNSVDNLDRKYFGQVLRNYKNSEDIRELQFEPTFTKEERASLHQIAQKYGLRSSSYGQNKQRRLIVSKKFENLKILREILIFKNARYMDYYFVQVPETKQMLFPEFSTKLSL
uniref:NF-kappa-B-repressing factor n=1 Tax=Glossina brevipalpis TaxID=37001 RepID=A0A1A9WIF2_9MUSC